jgi:hypothetical protein
MKCYLASEDFQATQARNREEIAKRYYEKTGLEQGKFTTRCRQCETEMRLQAQPRLEGPLNAP